MKNEKLKPFLIFQSTQTLSMLGSSMTGFALSLWLYEETGSALQTALLSICTYAPYVLMSVFAGALSDRWDKKKVLLVCDALAACSSLITLFLLKCSLLQGWHLYLLNAANGLMNTIQQPASDVSVTLITPEECYQQTSGLRSFSNAFAGILHPILATAVFSFAGIEAVIYVDLATFAIAFISLWAFIPIPHTAGREKGEPFFQTVKGGFSYLRDHRMILALVLFMAGVNFVAEAFSAALPAFVLPRESGGELVLGAMNSCSGIAVLVGGLLVTILPSPKERIRVIVITMILSLSIENFLLAFTQNPLLWCAAQIIGWLPVPFMNASLDVILRSTIPVDLQGRIYSCRNTLQFFTIPLGYFAGGYLIDCVFEPLMASAAQDSVLIRLFGAGKGAGAAVLIFLLGVLGALYCLICGGRIMKKYRFAEPRQGKAGDLHRK